MATIKYLADINLDKNSLNNAVIQNLSTAPSNPADGQIYYDTDTNDLNIYNGSGWVQLGATGAGDIESVVAGAGLTGGATSGDATLNVVGGTGITANANDIAITAGGVGTTQLADDSVTEDKLANSLLAEIDANTAKSTNVSTNLSVASSTGSRTIASSDGTNATIPVATTSVSGVMSTTIFDAVTANTAKSTNATHTGEVTGSGSLTIANNVVDEANLKISNSPTNGYYLTAQSGNSGGLTWAAIPTLNQNTTGSAATLTTARTIGGVSFNGSANINLPGVNTEGNQDTTGNAATATKIASITNSDIVTKTGAQTLTNKTIAASQVTEISNITAAEGAQIENIGTTTISAAQWGYLGAATGAITNTDVDVSVANLKTRLAGGFGSNAVTIGDSSDVVTIGNDLVVTGDLTVSGDTTTVNTATLTVEDPLIKLASGNTGDAVDTGFYSKYVESSTTKYAGVFRDVSATGNPFIFFDGNQAEPTTTVNTSGTGYAYADIWGGTIKASDGFTGNLTGDVTGDVDGNASSASTLATARTIGGVSFNGSANINLPGVNSAGNQNTTGSAATLTTARTINGTSFNGSANITVTAAATTLTGTSLKSTVVGSSLTSVGTIGTGVWQGTAIATAYIADDAITEDKLANTLLAEIDANTAKNTNVSTDLSSTTNASQLTINSSDGDNVVIAQASGTIAGVMTTAHHDKLDGIESGATADQTKSDIDGLAITTVGTLSSGNATAIVNAASTSAAGKVELATTAEALAGSDSSRAVTPAGLAARSYKAAIGDGSNTAIAVSHGLATRDVNVQMYDANSFETVMAQVVRTSTSVVTVTFNDAPATGDVIILINKID